MKPRMRLAKLTRYLRDMGNAYGIQLANYEDTGMHAEMNGCDVVASAGFGWLRIG
jgi:hypothetical protein